MRRSVVDVAVAAAVVLAGCGSSTDVVVLDAPSDAAPGSPVSSVSGGTAATGATGPLTVDDALLTADALPAPWELEHRDLHRFAYDHGPNQSDCDPYWTFEGS